MTATQKIQKQDYKVKMSRSALPPPSLGFEWEDKSLVLVLVYFLFSVPPQHTVLQQLMPHLVHMKASCCQTPAISSSPFGWEVKGKMHAVLKPHHSLLWMLQSCRGGTQQCLRFCSQLWSVCWSYVHSAVTYRESLESVASLGSGIMC